MRLFNSLSWLTSFWTKLPKYLKAVVNSKTWPFCSYRSAVTLQYINTGTYYYYDINTLFTSQSLSAPSRLRKMTVVQEGVSDKVGVECLLHPLATAPQQAMLAPMSMRCNSNHSVNVVTLDHYWETTLGKRQVDFLKVIMMASRRSWQNHKKDSAFSSAFCVEIWTHATASWILHNFVENAGRSA